MKKQSLTPIKLRIILFVVMLLLAAGGVGVFIYGYDQLKTHATSAQDTATKAEASRSSLQNLMETEKFLAANSDVVTRADQLASESKSYLYQDQIISDINKYASKAGIEITNISFDNPVSTNVSATPTPQAGTKSAVPTATPMPANVKSTTATVTIKSPTNYSSMLTFIHLIEQSLFRMQISKVGLSQASDQQGQGITSDTLTIEAYIR